MKRVLLFISILIIRFGFGQAEVGYLFEELPGDTIVARTIKTHSGLKPEIRKHSTREGSYLSITGLSDLNYLQMVQAKYKAGLGLEVSSSINDKWYFRLAGVQGISSNPRPFEPKSYLTQNEDSSTFYYTDIRSRIGFTPNQIFNFQLGLDHNFIGEGSRSLLLSDYGKPYPFGQVRAKFWRVEYSVLYQFMQDNHNNKNYNKFVSSHYLSFNAAPWLNFGLFESIIFQPKDSTLSRGFDAEYLNPLIFYRPQEYAIGSSDNALIGLNFSAHYKEHTFYGQVILDEFLLSEFKSRSGWWANKYGGQLGVKGRFDHIGKWFYRVEYNFVRPFTYAHVSSKYNYGNKGYSLAHPYGSNFMEALGELKYQKKKWCFKTLISYYLTGDDKDGLNYGTDIYESYVNRANDYNNFIGQGAQRNGLVSVTSASYKIIQHGNLNAFVENHFRYNVQNDQLNHMLVIGIRSLLWNDYRNY